MSNPVPFKEPPHNHDAEQNVITNIMLKSEKLDQARQKLKPSDFYTPRASAAFSVMLELASQGKSTGLIEVTDALKAVSGDGKDTDLAFWAGATDGSFTESNFMTCVDLVKTYSMERAFFSIVDQLQETKISKDLVKRQRCLSELLCAGGSTDQTEQAQSIAEIFPRVDCDPLNPPGLLGDMVRDCLDRAHRPQPALAVGAAIMVAAMVVSPYLRTHDDQGLNAQLLGIAASGSGKEAIQRYIKSMVKAVDGAIVYGDLKSGQELVRNLIENFRLSGFYGGNYVIDEAHWLLQGATGKGGEAYLTKIESELLQMSTGDEYNLPGDMQREEVIRLNKKKSKLETSIDEGIGNQQEQESELKIIEYQIKCAIYGIPNSVLNLAGYSTNIKLDGVITSDNVDSGLFGRLFIFQGLEAPERNHNRNISRLPNPEITKELSKILIDAKGRAEHDRNCLITFRPDAMKMLEDYDLIIEAHRSHTNIAPCIRRFREHIIKIASLAAIQNGVVEVDHLRWAIALVRADLIQKESFIKQSAAGEHSTTDDQKCEGYQERILGALKSNGGILTSSLLKQKVMRPRGFKSDGLYNLAIAKLQPTIIKKVEPKRGKRGHSFEIAR